MTKRPVHVLGFLGLEMDAGVRPDRWERWRPTVSIFQQPDLEVARFDVIVPASRDRRPAKPSAALADIRVLSPHTQIVEHPWNVESPWDFESVFAALDDLVRTLPFAPDDVDHLVHITTGTHVAQICLFLLTESRQIPGRLLQTSPARKPKGAWSVVDLELERYDRLAARKRERQQAAQGVLRDGIPTHNAAFAALMAQIERVASVSKEPILLQGPTGSGKTRIARRIYDLKRTARLCSGALVELNCATLRGDQAMSTLFGHVKGAFTGAISDRPGLLRAAHQGVLFLDEIGELGLDEQAMLLRALEDKRFLPLGADQEVQSNFQLVAGSHADLMEAVRAGRFREDLLARINLWTFRLPGLAERLEDVAPNLAWELDQISEALGRQVRFTREAHTRYLAWATGPQAAWRGNFRDLHASVVRMATLAPEGRIDTALIEEELLRLGSAPTDRDLVDAVLGDDAAALDRFDRVQLADVLTVCHTARSLSDAGRTLFAASRQARASLNDADRLRKYLQRFGLTFADVQERLSA